MKNKIVVIGGGNIGALLYAELVRINPCADVVMATRNKHLWTEQLRVLSIDGAEEYYVETHVTEDVVSDADYYFFTLPKHVIKDSVLRYMDTVKRGAIFVFLPGTGGVEFLYAKAREKGIRFIGMQRVPYIARLQEYGKSVVKLSVKDHLYCGGFGIDDFDCIGELLRIPVIKLKNYLCVTLTPSNPILHTSRLFSLFSARDSNYVYNENFLFYEQWDDRSSTNLLNADAELQAVCHEIRGLDLSEVVSLKKHYESDSASEMTAKISGIPAFQGIKSPMIRQGGGYRIDMDSRYFLEDFDYGLAIIKAVADLTGVNTPCIDRILEWFGNLYGIEVIRQGHLIGREKLLIPQNYDILSIDELVDFYNG